MKLKVTQENLAKALSSVSRVSSPRNTLPILANVLLKTIDNRLSIAATNLDIAISYLVGSKVETEGAITVPARLMQDFVSSLPGGVIELELDDTKLHINTDKYKSTINGTAAEEYPVMPKLNGGNSWQIPGASLKKALQQVVLAASSDEARQVLTGVYIHDFEGKLYAVATDSYRLAEKNLGKAKDGVSLLIPGNAMQELLRILGDESGEVSITHDDQQVQFKIGEVELVTRLIEGKYPDYRKLMPQKFSTSATLKREDFANINKVSALFARESAGSITISLDENDKKVSIKSVASQLGENSAVADAEVIGGGELTLNSRYLADALHVFSGENIVFAFNGKLEPSVLSDPKDKSYTHIIMPLRS